MDERSHIPSGPALHRVEGAWEVRILRPLRNPFAAAVAAAAVREGHHSRILAESILEVGPGNRHHHRRRASADSDVRPGLGMPSWTESNAKVRWYVVCIEGCWPDLQVEP